MRVQFTDESTGEINSWSWDFGDGKTSMAQSPSHNYLRAGKYTVRLTVTGPGGTDEASATITVVTPTEVLEPASFVPSNLHISPQQAQPNQQVGISVNIGNNGGQSGSYQAVLVIDGPDGRTTQSKTVGVEPGSSQNVVFSVSKATPGTYHVSLAGLGGSFTVVSGGVSGGGGLGTAGIICIVVVAIALIAALVFLLRRRA